MEVLRRSIYRGSLGQTAPMTGARSAQITLTSELMGASVTPGDLPPIDKMLRMCGLTSVQNAGRCVMYEPKDPSGSDPLDSGAIVLYQDTLKHVLTGCRGTFTLNCEAGQIGNCNFTIDAMDFTYLDNTGGAPSATGLPTLQPPVVVSAGLGVGSPENTDTAAWTDVVVPSIAIDMNNTIARGQSINTASGYKSVEITGRGPTGTMSPEAVLLATHPFYTDWTSGNKSDLIWNIGNSGGNQVKLAIPGAYYTGMSFEERDGILAHPTPFDLCLVGDSTTGMVQSGADVSTTASTVVASDVFTVTVADARTMVGRRITMTYGDNNTEVGIITHVDGGTTTATVMPQFSSVPANGDTFTISEKELQILFY
jgi:hypothetical protein